MADSVTDGINDFNNQIIAGSGRKRAASAGPLAGTPKMLIHHIGTKSGIERGTPLGHGKGGTKAGDASSEAAKLVADRANRA